MGERRERRKFRRGHFREERHRLSVALGFLAPTMPQPPADAELCDGCGRPMILDAMGELWMCGNFMCAPAAPPLKQEVDHG